MQRDTSYAPSVVYKETTYNPIAPTDDPLQRHIIEMNRRLYEKMDEHLHKTKNNIDNQMTALNNLVITNFHSYAEVLEKLVSRVDSLEQTNEKLVSRVDSLEQTNEKLVSRVDSLEQNIINKLDEFE